MIIVDLDENRTSKENRGRLSYWKLKIGKDFTLPTFFPLLDSQEKINAYNNTKQITGLKNIEGTIIPILKLWKLSISGIKSNGIFIIDPCIWKFFYKGIDEDTLNWLQNKRCANKKIQQLYSKLCGVPSGEGSMRRKNEIKMELAPAISNFYREFLKLQVDYKPHAVLSLDIPIFGDYSQTIEWQDENGKTTKICWIDLAINVIKLCQSIAKGLHPQYDFFAILSIHNGVLNDEVEKPKELNENVWDYLIDKIVTIDADGLIIRFIPQLQSVQRAYRFIGKLRDKVGDKMIIAFNMQEVAYGLIWNGLDAFSCEVSRKPQKGGKGKSGVKPKGTEGGWYHPQYKIIWSRKELMEHMKSQNLHKVPCNCKICTKLTLDSIKQMARPHWRIYTKEHYLEVKNEEIKFIREGLENKTLRGVLQSNFFRETKNPDLLEVAEAIE